MNNLEHFSMVWLSVGRIFQMKIEVVFNSFQYEALMKIETMKHGRSSWMLSLIFVHPYGSLCILGSQGTKVRQKPLGLAAPQINGPVRPSG